MLIFYVHDTKANSTSSKSQLELWRSSYPGQMTGNLIQTYYSYDIWNHVFISFLDVDEEECATPSVCNLFEFAEVS